MSDIPRIKTFEIKKQSDSDSVLIPKIDPIENDVTQDQTSLKEDRPKRFSFKVPKGKRVKILTGLLVALFVLVSVMGILTYRAYTKAQIVRKSFDDLTKAVNNQDLDQIKNELGNLERGVSELKSSYRGVAWIRILPFIGGYISDGQHALNAATFGLEAARVVIDTVEPYADIIGFKKDAKQAESGEESAQDRIDFVIATIPNLIPKADILAEKVNLIRNEVDQIEVERYPASIAARQVKERIKKGIELVDQVAELTQSSKPLIEAAPYLLGVNSERTYLVLFQNDKELRPTGGFITAYSIANVNKGRFQPVSSDDIYNLDSRYKPKVEAPEPLRKYIKGPYLISKNYRLRDMNWSPDFSESMDLFTKEIDTVGLDDIDAIIAVDTQVVVNLLDVIGPIGVPGFGEFSTKIVDECKCPQVIYELESFADIEGPVVWSQDEPGKIIFAPPNYENRKKIIGPLMNSILANALGQPKDKIPALFEAGLKSLTEKHVLFYFFDKDAQRAVEAFGIAGTIDEFDGDYLHINDANLGGRKSNLYVTQEVQQDIEISKDGSVVKTVTITYKNPERYDGWLNSVLPNWVRIYVPKGSELIEFTGVEEKEEPYEDLGKTVFAGFFELRPQGVAKVTLKYKLPFKVFDEYKLFLQKQPGKDVPLYTISLGKSEEELFLKTDKELKIRI